ncbi:MAG: hypothetical protein K8R36_13045 [Planctomycetales bacterium]|nr:hypothetical protein [Planctomycetales bacterium]
MFQFSLRNLLIAVACFAFGSAALVSANPWWVAITWSAALFSLAAAVLLAVYRREEQRAFWSGFAIFGALYVLLLMYSIQPVSSSNSSMLCLAPLSYFNLLTTKLSNWSYSLLPAALTTEYLPNSAPGVPGSSGTALPSQKVPGNLSPYDPIPGASGPPGMPGMLGGMPGGGMPAMPGMPGFPVANPRFVNQTIYLEVSHALWIIFLATLGGTLSGWFYKTRQQPRS